MGGHKEAVSLKSLSYGDPKYIGPPLAGWRWLGNAGIKFTQREASEYYQKYHSGKELTARAFEVDDYWSWAVYVKLEE